MSVTIKELENGDRRYIYSGICADPHCGKKFERVYNYPVSPPPVHCCYRCYDTHYHRIMRQAARAINPISPKEREVSCEVCGDKFKTFGTGTVKYCSDCRGDLESLYGANIRAMFPEKAKKYQRDWRRKQIKEDPEFLTKDAENQKNWYQKNKEKQKEYNRRWREKRLRTLTSVSEAKK